MPELYTHQYPKALDGIASSGFALLAMTTERVRPPRNDNGKGLAILAMTPERASPSSQ